MKKKRWNTKWILKNNNKMKNNVKLRYCCFQKLSEKKRLENQNKPKKPQALFFYSLDFLSRFAALKPFCFSFSFFKTARLF